MLTLKRLREVAAYDPLTGTMTKKPHPRWGIGPLRARDRHGYKQFYLGLFNCAEDAHAAYMAKARELHGAFARAE